MSDLIDRHAATQIAIEFIVEYLGGVFDEDLQKMLMERMNALPSAQPEIIHCQDCEKYGTKFCAIDIWTDQITIRRAKPDDFCSKGAESCEGDAYSYCNKLSNKGMSVVYDYMVNGKCR